MSTVNTTNLKHPDSVTNNIVLNSDGTVSIPSKGPILSTVNSGGTNPFPSTGGPTSVDFTGIPSWVKKITVMFLGVSTSGVSPVQIQIGAGTVDATSYLGAAHHIAATATTGAANSTGFRIDGFVNADNTRHGAMVLTNVTGNAWVMQGSVSLSDAQATSVASGSKTLSGTLDRIRVTTVAGNQAFDAGSINIMYE